MLLLVTKCVLECFLFILTRFIVSINTVNVNKVNETRSGLRQVWGSLSLNGLGS